MAGRLPAAIVIILFPKTKMSTLSKAFFITIPTLNNYKYWLFFQLIILPFIIIPSIYYYIEDLLLSYSKYSWQIQNTLYHFHLKPAMASLIRKGLAMTG